MAAAVEIGQVRKFCEAKGLKVLGYKGSGSYGKVFHVESKVTHLRYVAKVCTMKEDFTPDNFRREASLQERLSSKYIACDCSLVSYVKKQEGCILPENTLRDVCHDVSHAIVYLHARNIAHRDIKPANILICNSAKSPSERPIYKQKRIDDLLKSRCGTPAFMPQEMYSGDYGVGVDCWALGMMAYLLATHSLPFKSTERKEFMYELFNGNNESYSLPDSTPASADFRDFVNKLLTKDPQRRLHTKDLLVHPFIACKYRKIDYSIMKGSCTSHSDILSSITTITDGTFEPEALDDSATWRTILGKGVLGCGDDDTFVMSEWGISSLGDPFPRTNADVSCFVIAKCALHAIPQVASTNCFHSDRELESLLEEAVEKRTVRKLCVTKMDAYCQHYADYLRKAYTFRNLVWQVRRSLGAYIKALFAFVTRAVRCVRDDDATTEERYSVVVDAENAAKVVVAADSKCEDLVNTFCNARYDAMRDRALSEAFSRKVPFPTNEVDRIMCGPVEKFRSVYLGRNYVLQELVSDPLSCWNLMCESAFPLVRADVPSGIEALYVGGSNNDDDVCGVVSELKRRAEAFIGAKDELRKVGIHVSKKTYLLVEEKKEE